MEEIILLGAGGHAKMVVDTLEQNGDYKIAGFVERQWDRTFSYRGYCVIGTDDGLEDIYRKGIRNAFVCVGFLGRSVVRQKLYSALKGVGFHLPVVMDATACVAADASIEEGAYVGRHAVVGADAHIGKMCIINTASVVEHDCMVGSFSHIAVGAVLCGGAVVGENCMVGANATVLQQRTVGSGAVIGAGTVVPVDIPESTVYKNRPEPILNKQGEGKWEY